MTGGEDSGAVFEREAYDFGANAAQGGTEPVKIQVCPTAVNAGR